MIWQHNSQKILTLLKSLIKNERGKDMSDDGSKLLASLMGALGDNPEEKIGQLLSALSTSDDESVTEENEKEKNEEKDEKQEQDNGGFDLSMLMKIQSLMGLMSGGEEDERSTLLCALKPFLSDERKPDIDRVIKLLKLSKLAQTAQEMDLFKNLL